MQHISREDLQALIAAAAFTRLGSPDVRIYPGGKAHWADADLPFQGTQAIRRAA